MLTDGACHAGVASRACDATDPSITNFTPHILKTTDHTFGLHSPPDHITWGNAALRHMLAANTTAGDALRLSVSSWIEQREYIDHALGVLSAKESTSIKTLSEAPWQRQTPHPTPHHPSTDTRSYRGRILPSQSPLLVSSSRCVFLVC